MNKMFKETLENLFELLVTEDEDNVINRVHARADAQAISQAVIALELGRIADQLEQVVKSLKKL